MACPLIRVECRGKTDAEYEERAGRNVSSIAPGNMFKYGFAELLVRMLCKGLYNLLHCHAVLVQGSYGLSQRFSWFLLV
jgi:hypothetical protein